MFSSLLHFVFILELEIPYFCFSDMVSEANYKRHLKNAHPDSSTPDNHVRNPSPSRILRSRNRKSVTTNKANSLPINSKKLDKIRIRSPSSDFELKPSPYGLKTSRNWGEEEFSVQASSSSPAVTSGGKSQNDVSASAGNKHTYLF